MKIVGFFAIASILVLGSDGQAQSCETDAITSVTPAAHADFFAANFVKALERVKNGSFVTSPLSASTLLGMLSYGAYGEVQASLKRALDFAPNQFNKEAIKSFMDDLRNDYKSVEFIMANKIYVTYRANSYLTDNFRDAVVRVYHSAAQSINFSSKNTAAQEINNWFSTKTDGRFQDVINPSSLHQKVAAIVLGSAISFRASWKSPFDPLKTINGDFYVNGKNLVTKQMMVKTNLFDVLYIPELDAYRIELPYQSNSTSKRVSMFAFVPNKVDGLAELESKFNHRMLNHIRTPGRTENIRLTFPKFKIESTIDLKEPLSAMGLEDIFGGPRFAGITTVPVAFRISKAVQTVVLEVNEDNNQVLPFFEDRPATGYKPLEFTVNRPFLGFIGPAEGEFVNFISFRYTGEE